MENVDAPMGGLKDPEMREKYSKDKLIKKIQVYEAI